MVYSNQSRLGELLLNQPARDVLRKHFPSILDQPYLLSFLKTNTLEEFVNGMRRSIDLPDHAVQRIVDELASVPVPTGPVDRLPSPPSDTYESADTAIGSAAVQAAATASKWGVYEVSLSGPTHGNPFVDVELHADFRCGERSIRQRGFYDGDGQYKIRFMPDAEGEWSFRTASNARSLDSIEGRFQCGPAKPADHGPVRVNHTFHFAYEDGTAYLPIGTTCYAWTHQSGELEEQTLRSLRESPFNKVRMCVFPKAYLYNLDEPPRYPFEGSLETGWDFERFNPSFFRHLERRIAQLGELGIEADLILFHPYDIWDFSEMPKSADDRYLKYVTARLAAYANVWWSLANEFDLMWAKTEEDWERFASIVAENDPYGHLMSIHNCRTFYDYGKPWVTHCSIQRIDVYKTAEATNEWREQWGKPIVIDECAYEGDIDQGWGNITGEEMTRRFWEGAIRGGYAGHGETYLNPEEVLWWSKGGKLTGTSPERIAFLRRIMEESPGGVLEPLPSDWDLPCAGKSDEYYLYYFGFNRPRFRTFRHKIGIRYRVEVIDTWNMTIETLPDPYEGSFRIELPARPFIAVRLTKWTS
ncbi:DUF5605 domain-containing protein [Cohnella caldifontis]|uniref:DUF5605 domain-containing protein n=1 Tax=Cohnella caldifontis TaxID=3027471 RepID=UPI0023EDE004|nr:DUF5605 domain-containing protein [Cohnella sp. YIM B05605]